MLTSARNKQSAVDAEYTILVTDMMKNAGADGVLINLNGEVVGIMQEQHLASNMQNVLTAYGISDIKGLLEHLSNNQDVVYLGIKGTTVTKDALDAGVPEGIYVTGESWGNGCADSYFVSRDERTVYFGEGYRCADESVRKALAPGNDGGIGSTGRN